MKQGKNIQQYQYLEGVYSGLTLCVPLRRFRPTVPWDSAMTEPNDLERLKALDERLEKLKKAKAPGPKVQQQGHEMANVAWRMVTELVAGLLIGFGIGYGLDVLFGTMPLFLVLFILLGLAAGIRVMMRSAADVQRQSQEAATAARNEGD